MNKSVKRTIALVAALGAVAAGIGASNGAAAEGPLAPLGQPGGNYFSAISNVNVGGFNVRAGSLIDAIQIRGMSGSTASPWFGGTGGTPQTAACGARLKGVSARHGLYVDALQSVCYSSSGGWYDYSDWVGGSGGTYASRRCPGNEFVVGIMGQSGSLLDVLQLICAAW